MAISSSREPGFWQGIMLLLPITLSVMGITVLTPVVHLMLDQFKDVPHHEYWVIGGILTMPAIWILLFSPVAGWLADRYGRRNLLLLSMVVYAFVGVMPTFLDNLYLIILSRVGVGICEAVLMTVSTTLISDYFKGRARERWLASQTAVASVSALGIIYLGGRLGAALGWRGPFYLYLYSLLLAVGVYWFIWEPAAAQSRSASDARPAAPVAFPWARTLGICALTVLASVSFYTVITKNAEAMVSLGVSDPAVIGEYTMLASIGVPLGTFLFWGLARLPIGWLLLVDFALIGAGFTLMGRATEPTGYAWGSFVNQIGCGIVLPTMLVWATRGLAFSIRGRGNGMWQASFAIGQFVSGMVVTLLSKQLGGLLPTLGLMGRAALIFAVIAGVAGILWRRVVPPVAASTT
ncbi:MAG: MFS transporter [Steroidobacteraceae bacterium]|jgi:MFS family permease